MTRATGRARMARRLHDRGMAITTKGTARALDQEVSR
jgi:hypothetical protein